MTQQISMRVNGQEHTLEVPMHRLLIDCLRYDLGLTGTKEGCSVGVCGACTVLMDGQMTSSCLLLAVRADDTDIVTIEGLAEAEQLHPIQQAFIDYGGFQCGICTPGMIMAAKSLLDGHDMQCRRVRGMYGPDGWSDDQFVPGTCRTGRRHGYRDHRGAG